VILYLHGFLSSPLSKKAGQLRAALLAGGLEAEFLCPQLPVSPRAAAEVALAAAQLEEPSRLCLVGSSLGGYYATWVAERLSCRAVLLNPAVRPYELLGAQVGMRIDAASGRAVAIRPEHLDELRALETGPITRPERYFLVAASQDEVIDHRTMMEKYARCAMRIVPGDDHALRSFAQHLDEVLRFCAPSPSTAPSVPGPSLRGSETLG